MLPSGMDKVWWAGSMDCYCYLRNMQDLLSDVKTPCGKRFGVHFHGPATPFGATVEHHHISSKNQSRLNQFGAKVLP